ncbi:transcriptional regulator [Tractidigestivibacter scatoligenes]|uniref:Transcriptional regulator n=1 Tax=Tractidigestivibacter scatoligenes TaxID=1299998 RepID=A0A100YWK3_TRASO|nr:P-II family nitrogen regulator [Tractidigestivibacter scatoligenes]KUH58995.1 transcriptional regulator [Tractidigestivibacter scatoligenes]
MKEIEFIINGSKLPNLITILSGFSSNGVFITQGFGYGHQHGKRQVYTRNDDEGVMLLPKTSVRTVVPDDIAEPIIDEAVERLGNSTFGDGKIFIRDVDNAVRVRTNERGDIAL